MPATFTYAAVYMVEAVCQAPLRTGGTDGNPEQVLRDQNGTAFLQGASLAGALKGWLETGSSAPMANALFGSQESPGHLMVSDAVFEEDAEQYTRPRLRIDPKTGSAAMTEQDSDDGRVQGAKFDMAHIGTGAKLRFSLTWLGFPEDAEQELSAVEQMLAALDSGEILLGAQKSNGFGRVRLSVKNRLFDLSHTKDRRRWLADELEGMPLVLPKPRRRPEVLFTVKGQTGSILVKTAPSLYWEGEGKEKELRSYTPNLSEGERTLLPGSSIKGPVRARAAYILKSLALDEKLVGEETLLDKYFGRESKSQGKDQGLPGLLRFSDAELSGQKKKTSRIRIDRFTGGVFRGGLFTEEPVSTELTLRIAAPCEPAVCGLLLYALRDLGLGLYGLGSGWAVGRGLVAVESIQAEAPDGQKAVLRFGKGGSMKQEDPSGLFRAWLEGLEAMRHED